MDFLTEVDKLVQLIECPIFTCKAQPLPLGFVPCTGRSFCQPLHPLPMLPSSAA